MKGFNGDTRARIPFALIGVLLLVTSAAYATGVADQGLVSEDRSVERAVERVDADTTAALKRAAREAAHDAAAEPVTDAPDDGSGGVGSDATIAVRPGSAFEDAFRIRIALAAEASLSAVETEVNDVSATAAFVVGGDGIGSRDLRTARDRITVEPVADGTATRVTFEDVTVTATRDGRPVAEETADRTVVVAVPTLAAHERTERFEDRLNRGPVEGAGLGRQLTASLYPMTWARGYAQYGGAPVRNVLANRHVELSTNAGIVRTQRDVFGESDPGARGGVAAATARTGVADLLAPTALDESAWSDLVVDTPTPTRDTGHDGFAAAAEHEDETTTVPVGHAADVAAIETYEEIETRIEDSYRVEATLNVDAERVVNGGVPRPPRPDTADEGEWVRVDTNHNETARVVGHDMVPSGVPGGTVTPGESVDFGTTIREVIVERTASRTWERVVVIDEDAENENDDNDEGSTDNENDGNDEGGSDDGGGTVTDGGGSTHVGIVASADRDQRPETNARRTTVHSTEPEREVVDRTTTSATVTDRYHAVVSVSGVYAPNDDAPGRPTATFGTGGSSGPDLTGTPSAARSALDVETAVGVEDAAHDAVVSDDIERTTVVFGEPSSGATDRIRADLDELRTDVRAIDASLSMGSVAAGEADAHAALTETVQERRAELLAAPNTYGGAEDRARVAARAAYLAAVVDELDSAADDDEAVTDGFFDRVENAFDGPSIGQILASREAARDTRQYRLGEEGPGGYVQFTPDGSPGYLPRTPVDGATVDAVDGTTTRPLATRNLNYVTVPYGDVAGGITDRILGTEDTVGVDVAGRALLAADDSLAGRSDPDLEADRDALAGRIEASRSVVDDRLESTLADRTSLTREERASVLASVAGMYDSTGARAVAIGDGEYADRVADEAARTGSLSAGERAELTARLHVTLRTAAGRDAVRVPTRFVDGPTERVREEVRGEIEGVVEDGAARVGQEAAERWAPKPVRSVGAGLPVAPVPGYWIATVNAWRVEVRGEYPRFTLRADVGEPGRPFEYVREDATVTVSVDGDPVEIGSTAPIAFETGTVVAVAVPAGPPGVGDVDGTRDETSAGW